MRIPSTFNTEPTELPNRVPHPRHVFVSPGPHGKVSVRGVVVARVGYFDPTQRQKQATQAEPQHPDYLALQTAHKGPSSPFPEP